MDVVRWGIIGCGEVTEVKSGPGFQKASGSRLVAVMRRNGDLAADYARRHGVARWYTDADALIADPEVDAVYIATPPSTHADYSLRCLAAGKAVLVEKPMALSLAEAVRMEEASRAAGVPLFVAHYRRALPRFRKVQELVASGAIGEVRFVSLRFHRPPLASDRDPAQVWRLDPAVSGGGHFWDLAPHQLDLLDHFFGPITEASGYAANQGGLYAAEDIVSGSFRHTSGVQGVAQWCFTAADSVDEIALHGSTGVLRFACFDASPLLLEDPAGVQQFDISNPPHVHQPMIQQLVDTLLGRATSPNDAASGVRTARVMARLCGQI